MRAGSAAFPQSDRLVAFWNGRRAKTLQDLKSDSAFQIGSSGFFGVIRVFLGKEVLRRVGVAGSIKSGDRSRALKSLRLVAVGGVAVHEIALELEEAAFGNGLASVSHEGEVEVEIVEGEDALGDDFAGSEAVTEEGLGEAEDVGMGVFAKGAGVEFELLVFDVDGAIGRESLAVTGAAGGVDAVKHVYALADHFEELSGGAEAHGVARLFFWEERFGVLDGGEHFFFGLADRDAANGVAVEVEIDEFAGRAFAEVGIDAALDDSEVLLGAGAAAGFIFLNPILAAFGPASGEAGGVLGVFSFAGVGWAFVEEHGDVGAEDALNFHAFLGAEHHAGAIEVALELDAFFGDLADF